MAVLLMQVPAAQDWVVAQAFLDALDGLAYLVSGAGVVLATGNRWNRFAEANQGEDAFSEFTIGNSIFDCIVGEEVRSMYRTIHANVLSGGRAYVAFEYRCDAPDVRRKLRMSVHAIALPDFEPTLLYQSQILSEVARPWMSLFEPARILEYVRGESKTPIVRMCSICQRVALPFASGAVPSTWVEADEYYRVGGSSDVRISHGLCGDCFTLSQAVQSPSIESRSEPAC